MVSREIFQDNAIGIGKRQMIAAKSVPMSRPFNWKKLNRRCFKQAAAAVFIKTG
jgi:hypothetical protein